METPESVVYFQKSLFVSLVNGEELDVDGKGGIAKVGLVGKITDARWVTGLNAPKGMVLWNHKLYVTDISDIIVINAVTGKIESEIHIDGSKGLNDLTVNDEGVLYASDNKLGTIYRIQENKAVPFIKELPGTDGLKAIGKDLYFLTDKHLYKLTDKKKLEALATISQKGFDGLEPVGNGDFIYTIYTGLIYYVNKNGSIELLVNTQNENINTADLYFDQVKKILYVPTLLRNSVIAYQLH